MLDYSITNLGVDYFTATTKDDAVGAKWWSDFAERRRKLTKELLAQETAEWKNRWYTGYRLGQTYWGHNQQMGYIIMAQGEPAKELWKIYVPARSRCTRLDLQVTVRLETPNPNWAKQLYERSLYSEPGPQSTLILNTHGGSTCYIGSRQSQHFGRVYDKGKKEGSYETGYLWRYEVQLNKPKADAVTASLYTLLENPNRDWLVDIQSFVYRWFNARGVTTLFEENAPGKIVAEVSKTVTTVDRKIQWLRSQVSPSVRQLIAAGHGKDTIDALGITYDQLNLLVGVEGVVVDL